MSNGKKQYEQIQGYRKLKGQKKKWQKKLITNIKTANA